MLTTRHSCPSGVPSARVRACTPSKALQEVASMPQGTGAPRRAQCTCACVRAVKSRSRRLLARHREGGCAPTEEPPLTALWPSVSVPPSPALDSLWPSSPGLAGWSSAVVAHARHRRRLQCMSVVVYTSCTRSDASAGARRAAPLYERKRQWETARSHSQGLNAAWAANSARVWLWPLQANRPRMCRCLTARIMRSPVSTHTVRSPS